MKRLIFLVSTALLFSSCGPESTSSPASEHNEDSLHQRDRTSVALPDTAATQSAHGAHGNAPATGMSGLMQQNMQAMMAQPSRGDADQDFAALMRVHHQGAIDMAQLELAQGTDTQLKSMAQNIVSSQRGEIARFDAYLAGHKAAGNQSPYYQQAMQEMKAIPHAVDAGNNVDAGFARMMIPHHQHGVSMAQAYLPQSKDGQLKSMAQNIIRDQQKEIATLQQWVKTHP
jgi:uncharacterized protein (DUF305 family)